MAIPDNRMSTVPVPGEYLPPNGDASQLLEWHEGGPIAITDTSAGLNYQGWAMTYSDPTFTITPDTVGLPQTVGLPVAGVTQLSFCFDQNGRVTIAYTQADIAYLYWFDTQEADFVTTPSAAGAISPALTLDDKRVTQTQSSDMLLFYTKQQIDLSYRLYMRMQRDRFDIEYEMHTNVRPNIVNLGMNDGLRVQISLAGEVPITSPLVVAPTSTAITETTATLGGNVASDGGEPVTERGTVWGLTADPNIIDEIANKNIVAGTTGLFTGPVTGLPDTTLINFRAYAINSIDTGYSSNSTFTTDSPIIPDPDFANVTLLLHANGANGSTSFPDNSNSAHVATANGNAQVSTAEFKYGGASALYDGTGDYLSVPYVDADFDWFTVDFTIEMWVRTDSSWAGWEKGSPNFTPSSIGRSNATTTANYWSFGPMNDGKVEFYYFNGSQVHISSAGSLSTGTWHHLAMTYVDSSGEIKLWLNGVNDGDSIKAGTPQSVTEDLNIGQGGGVSINGWLDDIRITKGVARYTVNFTPPTQQFPDS